MVLTVRGLLLGCLGALVVALPAEASRLERWRFDRDANRLEFSTDTSVQPRAQLVFGPTRVVIDLPGVRLGQRQFSQPVGGAITQVRYGQFDAETTRIVIELAPGYTLDPQQIRVRGITNTNWVVELPTPQPEGTLSGNSAPGTPINPGRPPVSAPGSPSSAAPTQLQEVRATPDGLFVRTSGQIPQVTLRRSRDRRSIEVEARDTTLAQARIPTPSLAETNRLGIRQLSVAQASSSPAVARLTLQVPAEGPDWQATASNLGGIVLLPLGSPVATTPTPPSNPTPPSSFPPSSFPPQPGIAIVQGISIDRGSRQVLVRLDQGVRSSVRYQGGESLVILSPARLAPGVNAPRLGGGDPLEGIEVRQVDGETVVLTLRPASGLSVGAPQALNSQLLSVPLLRGGGSISVTPTPSLPPFPTQLPNPQPPRPFPPSSGGRPIQTVPPPDSNPFPDPDPSPFPTPSGRRVVTIDPGHGGPDPGAVGIGGIKETDIVLDIAKQMATILGNSGVQVVLTRDAEFDLDLEPRVQIAERANSTVFVSIHANAISMSRPEVNGLETFYYSSGEQLANVVHNAILETVPVRDRGVRQARFYVIRRTSMPAILVETGYVTGAEDAPRLATSSHRRKLAEAMSRGILRYLR